MMEAAGVTEELKARDHHALGGVDEHAEDMRRAEEIICQEFYLNFWPLRLSERGAGGGRLSRDATAGL